MPGKRQSTRTGRKTPLTTGQRRNREKKQAAALSYNKSSRQSGKNSLRFIESERVTTIPGSTTFAGVGTFQCNPGLSGSFPWLSGHANLFENYRVHKLVYRYKNLKGATSNGNIIMSFDYDTQDAAPSTAIAATQSTVYKDGAPWRIFELNVPTDNRKLFTRSGVISGSDPKLSDMGALHVCAEGCADTSDHGYLEVDYDIEFFNKQPSSGVSGTVGSTSMYYLTASQNVTADAIVAYDGAQLDQIGITNTAGSFLLPAGTYLCQLCFVHVTGVITNVDVKVGGAVIAPPFDLSIAGNDVTATNTINMMFGVLVLATASAVTVNMDWASGTSVLAQDLNRITFQLA